MTQPCPKEWRARVDKLPSIDLDDPSLTAFAQRRHAPGRQQDFAVEGATNVARLIQSHIADGSRLRLVATRPHLIGLFEQLDAQGRTRLSNSLTPNSQWQIHVASQAELAQLSGYKFHRGCVALCPRPDNPSLLAWHAQFFSMRSETLVVYIDRLADPANIGAIIRNAACLGAAAVLISAKAADPFERRAIRAAAATLFTIPLRLTEDPAADLRYLARVFRYQRWAATLGERALAIGSFEPSQRNILMLGNEGEGLSPSMCRQADGELKIPMAPGRDSLNVAAASAIFIHALARPTWR